VSLVSHSQVPAFIAANYDPTSIDAALSWASSSVEAYCERRFTQVLADVQVVDPMWPQRTALLPDPPVTAVSLVEAWMPHNGVMAWVTLTNYNFQTDGLMWDTTGQAGAFNIPGDCISWPVLPKSLRVTYDHGYVVSGGSPNLPQPIIDAVIRAAAGYLANPYNLTERKVGDATYRWSERERTSLLDDSLLGNYRLVTL
jgi:hypothetical protein